MGSIPVVEQSPGLDRALADLPVLFVTDLGRRLTPALLGHVAAGLPVLRDGPGLGPSLGPGHPAGDAAGVGKWPWRFERLTPEHWKKVILETAETGKVPDGWVTEAHEGIRDGAEDESCFCWFPAGTCVDFPGCRSQT